MLHDSSLRPPQIWRTRTHTFDLAARGLIMGILNVTADSFSDGGNFLDPERALAHALEMARKGADIIDVGGESSRPGAEPVPEEIEMQRVLPIVERLAAEKLVVSIDTMKPRVARAAIESGAEIINDISGLREPEMREVLRETSAGGIAMHMQGMPRPMQEAPHYDNVVDEVGKFFRQTLEACLRCGVDPMRLAFDPGIGFGKTVAHNLALLRQLRDLVIEGRPLVLGVSRKSFIGKVLSTSALEDRFWPTVALTCQGRHQGAGVFRVHDVQPNVEALRMMEAIAGA
jgi:dihydropteroate synthase